MNDDSLGCAAALWVIWRWLVGDDAGCLSWMLVATLILAVALAVGH